MIKEIDIENFKSIKHLKLKDLGAFMTFAGPNGSGKSNFFDALDFSSKCVRFDPKEAIRYYGGLDAIKGGDEKQVSLVYKFSDNVLQLLVDAESNGTTNYVRYSTKEKPLFLISHFDKMQSHLFKAIQSGLKIEKGIYLEHLEKEGESNPFKLDFPVRLYRIEPTLSKRPSGYGYDSSELNGDGSNLAVVLNRLEKDDEIRETIVEWMSNAVPQFKNILTNKNRLDGNVGLAFEEEGSGKVFPAHLISDGTVYLLNILVAILDRPKMGLTLIEEPERGLHPSLIADLVEFIRAQATPESPIWVTTHSEAFVRHLNPEELMVVDKKEEGTVMKSAKGFKTNGLTLDQLWLSNALNGGVPW